MNIDWAERVQGMEDPAVRNILKITARTDITSFAGGLPSAASFPVAELEAAFTAVLREQGAQALQYSVTEGYEPLRHWVAERLNRQGITGHAGNIIITNGSQQGLDLAARIFLNPGDYVAVENPSYLAALQVFKAAEAKLLPIPMDEQGMVVEELAKVIRRKRPKFIYTIPTFQNPTGVTMSRARREALVQLAQENELLIIEDNPYGELRYSGVPLPAIKSLPGSDGVLYAGTISKIISPGLRVGWLAANEQIIDRLSTAKQLCDVLNNSLTQRSVYRYVTDNDLDAHVAEVTAQYKRQRDVMLESMARYFPREIKWTIPDGGMFIWVTLPEGTDAAALLQAAIEKEKVAYVPGTPFFADKGGGNTLRLNFSNSTPDLIESGMRKLGNLFQQSL